MANINISHTDEVPPGAFPALAGVSASGNIASRAVVAAKDRGLFAWVHELQPGAEIRWSRPPVGHTVYVWEGDVVANAATARSDSPADGSQTLGKEGVIAVEHLGEAAVRAGTGGAKLVHFHQREDIAPVKTGGHAHLLHAHEMFHSSNPSPRGGNMDTTLWLDSACPACGMWLHKLSYTVASPQKGAHYHTEDEIIFVLNGGIVLGRKTHPAGTALAIDAKTVYAFGTPEGGVDFINFRATEPSVVLMSRDGPVGPPHNEREMIRNSRAPATMGTAKA